MTPRFDLLDMIKTVSRQRRLIICISLAAGILGAVCYLLKKKQYKARTEFIVSNPLYADRNHFFRITGERYVDYFAGEDDIDRVIGLAMSDLVRDEIIKRMGLFAKHKLNEQNPKDVYKMHAVWKKNFNVLRTEYKNMEIFYTADDPVLASDVTNECVRVVEEAYRNYYISIKKAMYASLSDKVRETDSTVSVLTDSLARLREQYLIFDIISPSRSNMIVGNLKNSGAKDFGRGVEVIQNIESIKDQMVIDRSRYISLQNEFSTGIGPDELKFLKVISPAIPPVNPAGLGLILTTLACFLAGLFFSVLIVLVNAYFKALLASGR